MAIFYPVENLILSRPRRHFRTSVSPIHWQLRSLIGAGSNGCVYFPTGSKNLHLQRLDTNTLETETIKLLSFSPRCLVAQNGWVCCGGETGEFTAMQVEGSDSAGTQPSSHLGLDFGIGFGLEFDVGARIPSDSSRQDDPVYSDLRTLDKPIVASNKRFGRERVNCITMWFPPSQPESFQGAYDAPVAVLANNDKNVTIVGLESLEAFDEIEYPDCVNRAVLSPDGQLLVAVGDDPFLYVHVRAEKVEEQARSKFASVLSGDQPDYEWHMCRRVHLRSQRKDDITDYRGSFAACFSSTGRYLAVGTQYGVISVFNTSALTDTDRDPLLTYFPGSRPHVDKGAIREMAFSPGPFDLLAWSEDRGRIGIADIRSGFVARQIISLDDDDHYEHLEVTGRSAIDPRLLEARLERSDPLASSLTSTLDLANDAVRRLPRRLDALERYHSPLTGEETRVLEALQEHRRRREQRAEQRTAEQRTAEQRAAARELLRNSSRPFSSRMWATTATSGGSLLSDSMRVRDRTGAVARALNGNDPLISTMSQRDRIREAMREAQYQSHRDTQREVDRLFRRDPPEVGGGSTTGTAERPSAWPSSRPPRSRVLISRPGGENGSQTTSGGSTNIPAYTSPTATTGAGTPSLTTSGSTTRDRTLSRILASTQSYNSLSDDMEAMYNISADSPSYSESRLIQDDADATRRDRAWFTTLLNQVTMRDSDRGVLRRSLNGHAAGGPPEIPDDDETAGLSWSEDGSILYIGAEDGIYEYRVNITARKLLPSITLR